MKIRLGLIILLCIFAVSLTAQPARSDSIVRVGACATPGITWGVFIQDSFAYIADCGAVTVVNVSNPSNPWVTGTTFDAWAQGIFVKDTIAYTNSTGMQSRFETVSIVDPNSPYRLGWCYVSPTSGIDPIGICIVDTITYLAIGDDGLILINVSNPSFPDTIQSYITSGHAIDLAVQDTLIYIVDSDSLLIWNISNPFSLFPVSAIDMPTGCYGVCVLGSYAYVACLSNFGNDGRLVVVDISNPLLPQIASTVNNIDGDPIDVHVLGNYAYVVAADYWAVTKGEKRNVAPFKRPDSGADVEGGLRIIDISNPDSAQLIVSYDTPGDPRGVFVDSVLVFVADYDSLQILRHIISGIEEIEPRSQKSKLQLLQNYPNPFSSITTIRYQIVDYKLAVKIKIYDTGGKLVSERFNKGQKAGYHTIMWNGKDDSGNDVPSGIYFFQLSDGLSIVTKKLVVVH